MSSIQDLIISKKVQLDFAWHLCIYTPLILRPAFLRYFTSRRPVKYSKLPYIPLLTHIILGVFIVSRYQFRAITSPDVAPKPEILDAVLGVMNAGIALRLCKYESRGNPRIARVAFQVMALMILFPAVMCYRTAGPEWYHSLVKMHNAFIYVRWLLQVGFPLGIFSGFSEGYTIAVFFGGILGAWDARFPWDGILGVPLALVLHVGLVVVEKFVSSLIMQKNSRADPFIKLMLLIGLVEVGTYRTLKEPVVGDSKK